MFIEIGSNKMLKIKNLTATIDDGIILQDINFEVKSNSLHVIIGPKCSGKSGLVHAISGKPELSIKDGMINFKNKSILDKTQEERSFLGIFSSFQHLPTLDGVTNFTLVKELLKSRKDTRNSVQIEQDYKKILNSLKLSSNHGNKIVNDQVLTSAECRKNEIILMLILDPNLVIFDEFEKDIEPEELEIISNHIKEFLKNKGKSVIVVTQNKIFLDLLKPTNFNVLVDGNIKARGSEELYKRIVDYGYSQFS